MAQGTVKWFNADRGYGFIAPDDGTPDLFVHYSAVKAGGDRGLQDDQRVEFTVGRGARGPQGRGGPPDLIGAARPERGGSCGLPVPARQSG